MPAWYHAHLARAAASPWYLAYAVAACAASGPAALSGDRSVEPPEESDRPAMDAGNQAARARWERFDEARSWPAARDEPYVSRGHPPGYFLATVRVTPDSLTAYQNLTAGTKMAEGTVIVQFQQDPQQGVGGPVFVMSKVSQADWEFMVVDPEGWIHDRGEIPLCARCHAEAVADELFGLPPPAETDAGID